MRITTQMINEGARKAGLPIQGNSLLNYLKKDKSTSLFGSMNENLYGITGNTSVDSVKKSSYEKLEKTANKLMDIVESFTAEGEKTLFSNAKETGNKEQIIQTAKSFVDSYNSTIKQLKSSDSTLDMYYKEMFDEVMNENKGALESIGITQSSKGTLILDETKMTDADVDTLENTLGASGILSAKIVFLASRVSANAQTNANSYSNLYGASGDIQSLLNSKHEWWG